MTYRARGRSIIEVILVRTTTIGMHERCGLTLLLSRLVPHFYSDSNLLCSSFNFYCHFIGHLFCNIFGWFHYSPLHWQLFSSEKGTRAAATTAVSETGNLSKSIITRWRAEWCWKLWSTVTYTRRWRTCLIYILMYIIYPWSGSIASCKLYDTTTTKRKRETEEVGCREGIQSDSSWWCLALDDNDEHNDQSTVSLNVHDDGGIIRETREREWFLYRMFVLLVQSCPSGFSFRFLEKVAPFGLLWFQCGSRVTCTFDSSRFSVKLPPGSGV
jgi:hypothetical protein